MISYVNNPYSRKYYRIILKQILRAKRSITFRTYFFNLQLALRGNYASAI
jgi:hypothetical protein